MPPRVTRLSRPLGATHLLGFGPRGPAGRGPSEISLLSVCQFPYIRPLDINASPVAIPSAIEMGSLS